MKKIPSLFKRDYEGTRLVYDEVVEGSEWVLAGEGHPTVKWDGTACMLRGGKLYKRYDRKKNKPAPQGWEPCEDAPNEHTGHWPGWMPVGDGPDDKWYREALPGTPLNDGTYELVGPKVQGNPHGHALHHLLRHGASWPYSMDPRTFTKIREFFAEHPEVEGIVWHHHADGRMVKIKAKDFGLPWPPKHG